MKPTRWKVILSAMTLVVTAIGLASAANSPAIASGTTPFTWTVQVAAQTSSGAIQTMNYGPGTITIDKGDSIKWVAASLEIHTVSFINSSHPDSGYSPATAYMNNRTSQTWISHPGQFRNSGILNKVSDGPGAQYRNYTLKFTGTGTYHYICYVHGGMMMHGTVIVQPTGTRYPVSQYRYKQRTMAANNLLIEHGLNLWDSALGTATSHHVYVGASDMSVMVMRFIPGNVTIGVGQSITFDMVKNTSIPIPHTVTFGPEPASLAPVGDPTHWDGTGTLSSGVMLPPGFGPPGSSTYTVKFTHAGVYPYKCIFHDNMGMSGTVTVQ